MLAVEHDAVGLETLGREQRECPGRGPAERLGHPELVALGVARVADADAARPAAHPSRRNLTLRGIQQLRVAHAGEMLVAGNHRGHGDRARPRASAYLVDPDHDPVAGAPALSLGAESGIRRRHARGRYQPHGGRACQTAQRSYDAARAPRYARRGPLPLRSSMDEGLRDRRTRERSRGIPLQSAASFGWVDPARALRRRGPTRRAPPRYLVGPVTIPTAAQSGLRREWPEALSYASSRARRA